jgi:hypothetical protein
VLRAGADDDVAGPVRERQPAGTVRGCGAVANLSYRGMSSMIMTFNGFREPRSRTAVYGAASSVRTERSTNTGTKSRIRDPSNLP